MVSFVAKGKLSAVPTPWTQRGCEHPKRAFWTCRPTGSLNELERHSASTLVAWSLNLKVYDSGGDAANWAREQVVS